MFAACESLHHCARLNCVPAAHLIWSPTLFRFSVGRAFGTFVGGGAHFILRIDIIKSKAVHQGDKIPWNLDSPTFFLSVVKNGSFLNNQPNKSLALRI